MEERYLSKNAAAKKFHITHGLTVDILAKLAFVDLPKLYSERLMSFKLQSFTFYLIFKPFSCGFFGRVQKISNHLKKTTSTNETKIHFCRCRQYAALDLKIAFLTRKPSLSKNRQLEVFGSK